MRISNKTIVITGAGSGIGRELALLAIKKGANVVGVDLNEKSLAETQQLTGVGEDRFKSYILNVADREKAMAFPEKVLEHFGKIDGIINNAGVLHKFKPVNDLSFEEIDKVINVNFYGTLYLTKAFLPYFLKQEEAHIVNISSMGGFFPFPGQSIYGASKAATKILTESLYSELKDTPVKVTVIFPGGIETNIALSAGINTNDIASDKSSYKMLSPQKAAALIIDAMERNRFRANIGRDAQLMDLFYRFSPQKAINLIGKVMKKTMPSIV